MAAGEAAEPTAERAKAENPDSEGDDDGGSGWCPLVGVVGVVSRGD